MKINKLSLRDAGLFNNYLAASRHELSVYAFANILIWKGLFDISWAVVEDNLCVFFKDKIGCFLYLPPLGEKVSRKSVESAFGMMDKFNCNNKEVSRIENVEEDDLEFYRSAGYAAGEKFGEYLCLVSDLAGLSGGRFKHKRACYNYFVKHYEYEYLPFSLRRHKEGCLKLYQRWAGARKRQNQDALYQGMLKDGAACLNALLDNYEKLDLAGRAVIIDKKIKGFTFGYALNKDIFCILYEITDLDVRGLAQFIFSEFCRELKDFKYINIMDDSGLTNLKKVKLSYRPQRIAPAYIIKRKNGYR